MRVMTEAVQAIFEKANEGQPDTTQTICGYYGRACREMGRKPGRMPCLSCPLAKFLEGAERIIPTEGTVYTADDGFRYLCTAAPGPQDTSDAATLERVTDGWTLKAHNVYQFPNGVIQWDFSTDAQWAV